MELNIEEIKDFIRNSSKETIIYLGCDSERIKKRHKKTNLVRYTVAVVLHIDGKHGARVFGGVDYEKVTDAVKHKPFNRLWKEAERVVTIYEELKDVLEDRKFELHVDISASKDEGSNVAFEAAKGYILSTTGVMPKFKPDAFAASKAADGFFSKVS